MSLFLALLLSYQYSTSLSSYAIVILFWHAATTCVVFSLITGLYLHLFLLNSKYYQNEMWSNTIALYDKYF